MLPDSDEIGGSLGLRTEYQDGRSTDLRVAALLVLLLLAACTARQSRPDLAGVDGLTDGALVQRATEQCRARRHGAEMPPLAFTSDGCSLWPDDGWVSCCVEHDIAYWCGGSADDRWRADNELLLCIRDCCSGNLGRLTYLGVRVGGVPWQPGPWRWGYGFPGIRGYEELPGGTP